MKLQEKKKQEKLNKINENVAQDYNSKHNARSYDKQNILNPGNLNYFAI